MRSAQMPETTVNEYYQPRFWKNKIRFAKDFLIAPPSGDPAFSQQFCQRQFRILIPATADWRRRVKTSCLSAAKI
jgi:hypothetical protein